MQDDYLKFYFYRILDKNLDKDKNKFFYVAKNASDTNKLVRRLVHILLYYKSFVNYSKTTFFIDKLEKEDFTYLDDTLSYIVSTPYCKIVRYIYSKDKRQSLYSIYEEYNIDFNIQNYIYEYDNTSYSNGQLFNGIRNRDEIRFQKYKIKNELITDEFISSREEYLSRTVYRSIVE